MLQFALLALMAAVAQAEHVLVLTGGNFSETVKANDKMVVEFYAPWCGHCKKLAPEFEKAAESLKGDGIVLANVDATLDENKDLASKYGVRGFPTLKMFRGDEESSSEYQGPREADGIVTYCKGEFGPATSQLNTTEEVTEATKPGDDVVVLGVFDGEASEGLKTFVEVADSLRGEAVFKHTIKTDIVKAASGPASVLLYKSFDEMEMKYDGAMEKSALTAWIEKASTPKLVSLDKKPVNKKALAAIFGNNEVPKVIGVLPIANKKLADFQAKLIKLGEDHSDIHILYLDPAENPGAMEFFGAKDSEEPQMLVHVPDKGEKYSSGPLSVDKVIGWVQDFKAGKIEKTVKSEEIPESNDGPVKVVVAKQFEEIVLGGKNVMMEFYAPWCGHCKKLEPVWNELGTAFAGSDKVVIAKMDATANDVPDSRFDVKGFPTLVFISEKGDISKYDGGRTIEDLTKFVQEKVGVEPAASEAKDEL